MRSLHFTLLIVLWCCFHVTTTSFQAGPSKMTTKAVEADTCLAVSLLIASDDLIDESRFKAALSCMDSAAQLYAKHELWGKQAEVLIKASVYADYLDYQTKANYAKRALSVAQARLPENHLLLADAYRQNGEVYTAFQLYDSSMYYYKKALPIFEYHEKTEQIAWCRLLQAVNYYYLGENEAGQQLLEGAFWKPGAFETDIYSVLYNLRGVFYNEFGDLPAVIKNAQKSLSLELSREETDFDSSFIATIYNNLGVAYDAKGDIKRSIDYYQKALDWFRHLPEMTSDRISTGGNIGKQFLRQQRPEATIPYLLNNLALLQETTRLPDHRKLSARNFISLGEAYLATGQYDSAQYYLVKALETGEENYRASTYDGLAKYYLQIAQPAVAVNNLEMALALLQSPNKNENIHISRVYYRLGQAYAQQADYDNSLQYYQRALVSIKNDFTDSLDIFSNPTLGGSLYDDTHLLETLHEKARILALLPDDSGRHLKFSLSTYLLAVAWTDSLRQSYVLEDNELLWSKSFKNIYGEAIHTAYQLYKNTQSPKYLNTAFALSEKSKSVLLLEAFTTKTGRRNTSIPQALLDQERDLSLDIAYYEKTYERAREEQHSSKTALFQDYLRDARLELADLKDQMELDYPDYYQLKYESQSFDPGKLQAVLPDPKTALIEYFIGELRAYAFVSSQEVLHMIPLPHPDSIQIGLSAFRPLLFDTDSFLSNPKQAYQQFNAAAYWLYDELLRAAIDQLPASVDKLVIVPDEGLNTVPFDVFNTELVAQPSSNFGALPYLIKDYQIQYTYSVQLLEKNQERLLNIQPNVQCLAFAPSYQDVNTATEQLDNRASQIRNGVSVLENTAAEIEAISQHFSGSFIASSQATKARFMEQAPQYGILHLAMHGEADYENTKFGHLIFSNADTNTLSNNLLYHYEIANLDLNAQLAVLSACETGAGKYESGEGVFSIARSFMYAGVPSIVMSLWKVNDRSTSEIMPVYYQNMANGMHKGEALRAAKLGYLGEAGLEYRHPFYWASFIALGDQQPLRLPFPLGTLIGSIGILLLGIGAYVWYSKKK
jgi:CHAT domain-containing protein